MRVHGDALAWSTALWLVGCGRLGFQELNAATGSAPRDAQARAAAGDQAPDADAAGACATAAISDYCQQIPRLPADPVVDGQLDCGPPLLDFEPAGWTASSAIPADHGARVAVAFRPNGLYVYLEIRDSLIMPWPAVMGTTTEGPWCGDGVEIYVDSDGRTPEAPLYDQPGAAQLVASAPSAASATSGGQRYRNRNGQALIASWTSMRYGAYRLPDNSGYSFEAFVEADDLDLANLSWSAGQRIGFDIGINVSVSRYPAPAGQQIDCGRRLGQYFLRIAPAPCGQSCLPYLNANAFCKPMLL